MIKKSTLKNNRNNDAFYCLVYRSIMVSTSVISITIILIIKMSQYYMTSPKPLR